LQLIELVLIALTSFAILILAALFLSYFGYKTRKKIESKNIVTDNVKSQANTQHTELEEIENATETKANQQLQQEKYIVFNPGLTKISKETSKEIKRHTPHTLFIKK
jgi:hypothetical protein